MNDAPSQPARQWMPWWSLPAGMGLWLIAFAALFAGLSRPALLLGLTVETAREGGWLGGVAVLALWGAYVLCLALYYAKRLRWLFAGAAAMLATASMLLARPLDDAGLLVVFALLLGMISLAMLLIASVSLRHANRMVDADHWARHRLARGRCPRCGYDIQHLPQRRCPECGTTWSADELDREAGEPIEPQRLP